jgi:hypothetical protein
MKCSKRWANCLRPERLNSVRHIDARGSSEAGTDLERRDQRGARLVVISGRASLAFAMWQSSAYNRRPDFQVSVKLKHEF